MILSLLDKSDVIIQYDILDYKRWNSGYYLKIRAVVQNDCFLFIREYVDENERNYSYHWQKKDGTLIVRWDNSPYHKNIISFPHHKHTQEGVCESREVTVEDVLLYIKQKLVAGKSG